MLRPPPTSNISRKKPSKFRLAFLAWSASGFYNAIEAREGCSKRAMSAQGSNVSSAECARQCQRERTYMRYGLLHGYHPIPGVVSCLNDVMDNWAGHKPTRLCDYYLGNTQNETPELLKKCFVKHKNYFRLLIDNHKPVQPYNLQGYLDSFRYSNVVWLSFVMSELILISCCRQQRRRRRRRR